MKAKNLKEKSGPRKKSGLVAVCKNAEGKFFQADLIDLLQSYCETAENDVKELVDQTDRESKNISSKTT